MNGQLDFFLTPGPVATAMLDLPPPYQRHSETSKAAAESVRPKTVPYRTAIIGYVIGRAELGATREEISEALGIKLQTVCPRVGELLKLGEFVCADFKRPTRSGKSADVSIHKRFAK